MKLNFKIVTPERLLDEGQADQITLPTQSGQITVLPHHIPLVSNLVAGEVIIINGDQETYIALEGGFVEVQPTGLVILADAANRGDELDESEVAEAVKRAQEALNKSGMSDKEVVALKTMLDREMSKLKVARKYKSRGVRTGNN